ncbi:hypothetical protein [Streptomyces glaucus]|uniref:Secreted protein n=1 Tax=Streptomyces glaucus TaxID=284029 RepID=A0ABN3JWH3_9ACTN
MNDIAQDPGNSTSTARCAEHARPAWELYAATHGRVSIADLISDLLHLADRDKQDGDAETVLARAQRDYYAERGNCSPAPGTEYRFSISDIARATARILGDGWTAESGFWGVTGVVAPPRATTVFEFTTDYQGDLSITYEAHPRDNFPTAPALPDGVKAYDEGVYLEGASATDGLDALAQRSAAVIRAITGR